MIRIIGMAFIILSLISCAVFHLPSSKEVIEGVEIVSVEEIEGKDGALRRLVKGTVSEPLANDEEWLLSVYAIYMAKRLPGQGLNLRIYLDAEEDWRTGTPYAIAKFGPKALVSLTVDERLVKVPKDASRSKP